MIELHFAIAKAGKRHYQAKPIIIAGTTGLLSFDTEGLGATMGKNSINSVSVRRSRVFPLHLEAWGQDDGGQHRSNSRSTSPLPPARTTSCNGRMAARPAAMASAHSITRSRIDPRWRGQHDGLQGRNHPHGRNLLVRSPVGHARLSPTPKHCAPSPISPRQVLRLGLVWPSSTVPGDDGLLRPHQRLSGVLSPDRSKSAGHDDRVSTPST